MGLFFLTTIGGLILYALIDMTVKMPGAALQSKFQGLGTLKGLKKDYIIKKIGPPSSFSATREGKAILQWMSTAYHIALIFDASNICEGVSHEASSVPPHLVTFLGGDHDVNRKRHYRVFLKSLYICFLSTLGILLLISTATDVIFLGYVVISLLFAIPIALVFFFSIKVNEKNPDSLAIRIKPNSKNKATYIFSSLIGLVLALFLLVLPSTRFAVRGSFFNIIFYAATFMSLGSSFVYLFVDDRKINTKKRLHK